MKESCKVKQCIILCCFSVVYICWTILCVLKAKIEYKKKMNEARRLWGRKPMKTDETTNSSVCFYKLYILVYFLFEI